MKEIIVGGVCILLLALSAMADGDLGSLISRFQSERTVEAKEAVLFDITQHHPEAGQQLLQIAQETDDIDTKWLAIRGLGQLKYQAATQFLIHSLSSPHHYVRANATRALGELRANSATPELLGLLKTEQDIWSHRTNGISPGNGQGFGGRTCSTSTS